jgi:hypothetical protein
MQEQMPEGSNMTMATTQFEGTTVQRHEKNDGKGVDPEDYPKFEIGQVVVIDNFEFTIARFNSSSIVLKPKPTKVYPRSARRLMYHLRAGLGPYAPKE